MTDKLLADGVYSPIGPCGSQKKYKRTILKNLSSKELIELACEMNEGMDG